MPSFLSDPTPTIYVLFGAIALILGIVALRRQKKWDLIRFAIGLLLVVGLFLCDKFFESPRESVVRKIQEMGVASRSKKYDELFKHVSESFKHKSLDKKGLRDRAKAAETMGFSGISEFDLSRSNFKQIDDNTIEQSFRVKPEGFGTEIQGYVIATFKKEANDEWRLTTFSLRNPININEEMAIPGG